MAFDIVFASQAIDDVKRLRAHLRAKLRDAIEVHLSHEPRKTSRSRIKRLRGLYQPQYRLRVGDLRVFYDVSDNTVEVLAVLSKSEAEAWLTQLGRRE